MSITFKVSNVNENILNLKQFNIKPFIQDFLKTQVISDRNFYMEGYRKILNEKLSKEEEKKKLDQLFIDSENYSIEFKEQKKRNETADFRVLSSSFKINDQKSLDVDGLKEVGPNSFVYSCWKAYNQHHHLEIRPDDVYMSIMVQFSLYVNKHAETFRDRLVDFQGKEKLEVLTDDPILTADHGKLTLELSQKIKSRIKDPSIADWVIPNFSTTTDSDRVAFASVLLSTMKKFFNYSMKTRCGLPSVTLLGTVDDWSNLKQRLQKLKEFNIESNNKEESNLMDKWLSYLEPILDQLVLTASGSPDLQWWNSIAHREQGSGTDRLSGWLSSFCCFNSDGDWNVSPQSDSKWPTISYNTISNGFVNTPVLLIDGDGTEYNSTLFSGHIATTTNQTKIKPSIDWFLLLDPK
ncbi:hypothetical protein DICPUDRAFT_76541 [Dictyostelium purpureum]|uniref:Uncharacterized protein n=1 Tax=Dictyostelium purpureum TaxID=5786 RepID=F0ZDX5_DICPU|nr:uncharacterized protein DICPUDRAFT_76541 [Dictyostelium purpureum]EGC37875.1 hypothetical protein DICPUDRAFT_76541 [Dictyostelium purpureum]|eukprot:XP_003285625.1 hypothetical protein DICPUDRAFT_76541 [Dictyostelium purpureum]